jgi:Na+-driven multidrug efflux pump
MEQVARDIKRYMTTSIATVFVVTVLGIVDSLIAGRMIGEEALAVTGLAMPLFLISNMTVAVFANGGGVAAAQALGAGDKERASALVCVTLLASCCVAAAAALPLFFFAERVSALLGASDAILQMTSGYVKGSAFMLVVMTPVQCLAAFARADGRPWLSLSMLLLATVFNAFLDVLFIKAGAGMFGVAFATGLSYALAALVLVRYYLSGGCSYRFVDPLRHLALTKVTVATGLPNSLSFLWMTINSLAVNRILAALGGLHLLTASSVMNSTDQLMSFILMGPGYSLLTLMGIYYGKRDGAAIRFIAKRVLSVGLALTAVLGFGLFSQRRRPSLPSSASKMLTPSRTVPPLCAGWRLRCLPDSCRTSCSTTIRAPGI